MTKVLGSCFCEDRLSPRVRTIAQTGTRAVFGQNAVFCADESQIIPSASATASIVVRKGKAVFDINITKGPNAKQQLTALAPIVLERLKT